MNSWFSEHSLPVRLVLADVIRIAERDKASRIACETPCELGLVFSTAADAYNTVTRLERAALSEYRCQQVSSSQESDRTSIIFALDRINVRVNIDLFK